MAKHCYGCRVIQRLIEYCASVQISALLDEVLQCCPGLSLRPRYAYTFIFGLIWFNSANIRFVYSRCMLYIAYIYVQKNRVMDDHSIVIIIYIYMMNH